MSDCLIIGAGVIGLSLAYELSGHGWRVRVIDRNEPGREASWAGAGILPPANLKTADHPLEQLRGLSHRLHAEWAERLWKETGVDTGYRRCGGIYLAQTVGESAALAGFAAWCQPLDIEIQRLEAHELVALEPALAPLVNAGRLRAAYRMPDEAQLRNPCHLQALLQACRQRNVEVVGNVQLSEFVLRSGGLAAVHTSCGKLVAQAYCLCAGAWTHDLLRQLGVGTGILPVRGQMVLFHGTRRPFSHVLNEGSRYLVPRDDGYVLAGSTEEEVGFDKRTTPEGLSELTRFAYDLVPDLRGFEVERTWAGLRPGSFDGFPYIGAIPGLDNAFAAAGHFRSGLHLSTGTAVVLAELMRGLPPQVDLSPFHVGRG